MTSHEMITMTVTTLMVATGDRQTSLAASTGIPQPRLSRRLRGDGGAWDADELDALARHFDMAAMDILAGPVHARSRLPAHRIMVGGGRQVTVEEAAAQ